MFSHNKISTTSENAENSKLKIILFSIKLLWLSCFKSQYIKSPVVHLYQGQTQHGRSKIWASPRGTTPIFTRCYTQSPSIPNSPTANNLYYNSCNGFLSPTSGCNSMPNEVSLLLSKYRDQDIIISRNDGLAHWRNFVYCWTLALCLHSLLHF